MISLSGGFSFSCRGLSSISITLHVSFIDSHHHLRLRRSCISFLLFIWHSMQTPTAFKTLQRLSAQLIRNRESLLLPHTAAAISTHRSQILKCFETLQSSRRYESGHGWSLSPIRCQVLVTLQKDAPSCSSTTGKAIPSSL